MEDLLQIIEKIFGIPVNPNNDFNFPTYFKLVERQGDFTLTLYDQGQPNILVMSATEYEMENFLDVFKWGFYLGHRSVTTLPFSMN